MRPVKRNSTRVEVLRFLKKSDGYVSGQEISQGLSISRTAVWKHIAGLKKTGYDINSTHGRGYMLATSSPSFNALDIQSSLETEFIGRDIYFCETLASTNAFAAELAVKGAVAGTVVIADSQSSGKGRLGRGWCSPGGVNLYTSIILRPDIRPEDCACLTLVFAVAVAEAIGAFIPVRPEVKWPNDILIGTAKVCGILSSMSADIDRVNHVICGIGVNVNASPNESEFRDAGIKYARATSLFAHRAARVDRTVFALKLYKTLEKWYKVFIKDGFAPVAGAWREYFNAEGKEITVDTNSSIIRGVCAGIDDSGALLVREQSGRIRTVLSGDVSC